MQMSIDWDKPVQTEDECEARIFTTKGRCKGYPVVGERRGFFGYWYVDKWTIDGIAGENSGYPLTANRSLVNVRQKHTVWVNLYRYACSPVKNSKAEADMYAGESRIACVEVTYTEGEGLAETDTSE